LGSNFRNLALKGKKWLQYKLYVNKTVPQKCTCKHLSPGFTHYSMQAGPYLHLQSEVCMTNCHQTLSRSMNRQCKTSSGSQASEAQVVEPVRRHLQAPQWPSCAVLKRFSRDHCCQGR